MEDIFYNAARAISDARASIEEGGNGAQEIDNMEKAVRILCESLLALPEAQRGQYRKQFSEIMEACDELRDTVSAKHEEAGAKIRGLAIQSRAHKIYSENQT